ncbi:hypothetical protein [Bradyrhizobium sp. SRS-191]|uniref:hypothetical protein n=1 Tax=Bradyrhizobium sp. SRS-191 TaxID=2962606 RepID=UPI00211DDF31|nr:hypothetical protein [Bradyrhizobium sp. SRS-191]
MMSGGPIEGFTKGWACVLGKWGAAHYYTRDQLSYAAALCGVWEVKVGALRDVGTWTKCKRCEAKLGRMD